MTDQFYFNYHFVLDLKSSSLEVEIKSNAKTISLQAPSGTGKTTFIKTIAGINKNFNGDTSHFPGPVGYVPQDSLLIPIYSVKENLLLSPYAQEKDLDIISEALFFRHLLNRRPRMLSGGEKQRVSIGRALLLNPPLLILDEPFSGLDHEMKDSVANFVKSWVTAYNASLIFVSHDESVSQLLCQEFWTIKNNKLFKVNHSLKNVT